MHYFTFVFIEVDENLRKKVAKEIEEHPKDIAKFEANLKTLTFDQGVQLLEGMKPSNYEILLSLFIEKVKKPLDRYGGDTEDRKFDSWTPLNLHLPEDLLAEFDTLDYFPEAIMTSDCEWLSRGWSEDREKDNIISDEWDQCVKRILEESKENKIVLLINCDS